MMMSRLHLTAGCLLLALAPAATAQPVTVRFQDGVSPSPAYSGTRDTVIKSQTPSANFGALPRLRVTTAEIGGGTTWTLLRWNLEASIPPGCVVTDVRIRLRVNPLDPGATNQLYALLRTFTEGDGTSGSGATWNTWNGVNNWTSGGAGSVGNDRGGTVLASIPGGSGFQEVALNATGRAVVQGWVDAPNTNAGFVLRGSSGDATDYDSRETTPPANRPELIVSFQLPTPPPAGTTTVSFRQGTSGYAGNIDTYMRENRATTNYGTSNRIHVDAGPGSGTRWGLQRWDLTSIPAGVTVTNVVLTHHVQNTGTSADLYRCLRAWTEGGATWTRWSPGNNWTSGGAEGVGTDRENTILGTLPGTPASFVSATLNAAGRAVVQDWINTPASNNGWVLRGPGTNRTQYRSSEEGNASRRPQLTITYSTGPAGIDRSSAGGDWSTAGSWTPTGVPQPGDRLTITGPVVIDDSAPQAHQVDRVRLTSGGTLTVRTGSLTIDDLTSVESGTLIAEAAGTVVTTAPLKVFLSGRLELRAGGTVQLGDALTWIGGELRATGGTLEAANLASRMDVNVYGTLNIDGLTVRGGDVDGLRVADSATVQRLRGCTFDQIAAGAGSRFLTIQAKSLCLNAPGNVFNAVAAGQFNVEVEDTDADVVGDVAICFEDRGTGTNGAGVGPGFERELGGASVNWVHAAPDTTSGTNLGFPQVAYDLNTFALYATYVAFKDVDAASTDRIYVFDPNGAGVDQGYHFDVPQADGDLSGTIWWDQRATGERIVWAVTSAGRIFRWTNPGGGTGAVAPDAGFPVTITDGGTQVVFTSPPLTADADLVYAAGTTGGSPRFYALRADTGALAWSIASGLTDPITSELASELQGGVTRIFAGGGSVQPGGGVVLLTQDFNSNPGSFNYQDDTFRGTNNPTDATGDYSTTGGRTGGRVRVRLGTFGTDMSGGWRTSFTVPGPTPRTVQFQFAYRLIVSERHEFDEYGEALFSIDGTLVGVAPNDYLERFFGDGNGGPDHDSGWRLVTFNRLLTPGTHQLTLGGFANKSTEGLEVDYMLFDDVRIETVSSDGRIYRINAQTRLVEVEDGTPTAPIVKAPIPSLGVLYVGDQAGTIHGIDANTMNPRPGWPVVTGQPMNCNVWQDFVTGNVFFGNASGTLFGYDTNAAALANWPLADPFGDGAPIEAGAQVSGGVLWASNTSGRLICVDISAGSVLNANTYRLGSTNQLSRVATDFNGRPQVLTGCGTYVVVNSLADPTP